MKKCNCSLKGVNGEHLTTCATVSDETRAAVGSMFELAGVALPPGIPCKHPGCKAHISHPCEGCGRVAAGMMDAPDPNWKKRRG